MSSEKRPGGLTALAVVNFILGGLGLLGGIFTAFAMTMLTRLPPEATASMTEEQLAQIDAMLEFGTGVFLALALLSIISASLLIVAGVGYIKQRKFLGRTIGNAYGIFGIVSTLAQVFVMPAELGGGSFGLGTIIGLIYPVLTLALVNTAFKDDLVN